MKLIKTNTIMLIMITNRCHMNCPHCMQDARPDGKLMTDETFEKVLDFVRFALGE